MTPPHVSGPNTHLTVLGQRYSLALPRESSFYRAIFSGAAVFASDATLWPSSVSTPSVVLPILARR